MKNKRPFLERFGDLLIDQARAIEQERNRLAKIDQREQDIRALKYYKWRIDNGMGLSDEQRKAYEWLEYLINHHKDEV